MNILITGGASGLGEAITRKLVADNKNQVYFTYYKSEEKALQISAAFSNATAIKCDFKNKLYVQSICEKISLIDLDILINNAFSGDFLKTHFNKIGIEEFENDFKENILPVIEITQAAISYFRKKKSGKIITVLTSALISTPPVGSSVYVANKAYLAQLSKIWAVENAKFNITSNTVSPSFMQTNLTSGFDERLVEQMKENHPLKTLLKPDEVSEAVYFLVKASAQINGADIPINAGSSLK